MADYYGKARTPGLLGVNPGVAGRGPVPRGIPLWDKQTVTPAPAPGKAAIATTMPPPTKDDDGRDVHQVDLPLFSSQSSPLFGEVQQAPNLANCPVAAILAALAATSAGQAMLRGMVSESSGTVTTDISKAGTLANPPGTTKIQTSRYFTVKLGAGKVVVSDVLYTDDHDRGWSAFYMRDPKDTCIWAAIVEKALATQLGSYDNFDALNLSANDFWQKIVGSKANAFEVKADTDLSKIVNAATAAGRIPTIGASRENAVIASITQFHGYAMLGMQGSNIKLYDPAKAKQVLVSPADFRSAFQAVLFK